MSDISALLVQKADNMRMHNRRIEVSMISKIDESFPRKALQGEQLKG